MFEVLNNAFNREHYRNLIGQRFETPPGYAAVQRMPPPLEYISLAKLQLNSRLFAVWSDVGKPILMAYEYKYDSVVSICLYCGKTAYHPQLSTVKNLQVPHDSLTE